jgi:S-adenosylmethionine:tRNA ribosyltransferase-isomerase
LNVADFDFELPDELVAQEPPEPRGHSRLLVLDRQTGKTTHATFGGLADHLRAGDLLVVNNTRVFPARLLGRRVPSGGSVECLLLRHVSHGEWEALMHPGQKLKPGAAVLFERDGVRIHGEVIGRHFHGKRTIRLWTDR